MWMSGLTSTTETSADTKRQELTRNLLKKTFVYVVKHAANLINEEIPPTFGVKCCHFRRAYQLIFGLFINLQAGGRVIKLL